MSDFRLDFLCAGFNKCGTSSLHSVLKEVPEIRLPLNKKETSFFCWYRNYSDPIKQFQKRYFPDAASSGATLIRGAIEPSFMKHPDGVFRYFGKDIKLIFMLRNPADAIWAMFKMRLRRVRERAYSCLYRYEKNDIEKMFRRYLRQFVTPDIDSDFFYDRWLSGFMDYYPKEQIHIILFEDYIRDYQEQMKKLGGYLGFSTENLPALRRSNVGDRISRNYWCAEINHILYLYSDVMRRLGTNLEVLNEKQQQLIQRIQRTTLMDCPIGLSESNRRAALDVFHESVLNTEKLIGIPLEKRWYE